jgi:type 1 glutamine amidotransferase
MFSAPVEGVPVRDCPMAHEPLGIDSPLLDVELHPQGRAALEAAAPGLVSSFTKNFGGTDLPPGFAAILSPRQLLQTYTGGAALAPAVDEKLRALVIDDAFVISRCARYDEDRPALPPPDGRPAILVFEKINGFRDEPSLAAARQALGEMAKARGWQIVFTDRAGVMNPADLARFAAVVWNNVSGDALTVPQRAAFRNYVEGGGGFVGIHGAGGDPKFFWDWYADTLVGARFTGHPANPQFQTATVRIADRRSRIGTGVPAQWPLLEEWYSFDRNPADGGAIIVATIDEKDYSPVGFNGVNLAMGIHPVAWRKFVGDGRSFYTAIGHRPENYRNAEVFRLLANGIAWAMGK